MSRPEDGGGGACVGAGVCWGLVGFDPFPPPPTPEPPSTEIPSCNSLGGTEYIFLYSHSKMNFSFGLSLIKLLGSFNPGFQNEPVPFLLVQLHCTIG